jgi:DNA-binding transcriptional regulator YiaG
LRLYLRLTQGEMARYMEVDISTVRRWEYGARRPAGGNRRRLLTLARKHLSGEER